MRVLLLVVLLAGRLEAATYYVTTSGNDANPGTQAQPWLTIQKGANTAVAGDLVLVGGGTYFEKVTFTTDGTAGNPITFRADTGQTPIIDGSGVSVPNFNGLVTFSTSNYLVFDGFTVRDSAFYGILIAGQTHHLTIQNATVTASVRTGVFFDGPTSTPGFIRLLTNTVTTNGCGGITLWNATAGYVEIRGNTVTSNTATCGNWDGVQIGGQDAASHHVVVKDNTIGDNGTDNDGEDNLDLGGHAINHHYLVEGNDVYGTLGSWKLHSGSLLDATYTVGTSGFHIGRFNRITGVGLTSYGFPNPVAFYHNTFVNCAQCVLFYGENGNPNQTYGDSSYTGGDHGRMNVTNTVFWQEAASSSYLLLQAGPVGATIDVTYASVRFRHNLYKFASGNRLSLHTTAFGPPVDATAFANYKAFASPNLQDVNSLLTTVATSAMFANYATRDYHLVAGAPAIDAGMPVTTATNSGSNAVTLTVDRASYFQDGYCTGGECVTTPDTIVIGAAAAVAISAINDVTNTITLAAARSWTASDPVTLVYSGAAPDIGAWEFDQGGGGPPPSGPTRVRFTVAAMPLEGLALALVIALVLHARRRRGR